MEEVIQICTSVVSILSYIAKLSSPWLAFHFIESFHWRPHHCCGWPGQSPGVCSLPLVFQTKSLLCDHPQLTPSPRILSVLGPPHCSYSHCCSHMKDINYVSTAAVRRVSQAFWSSKMWRCSLICFHSGQSLSWNNDYALLCTSHCGPVPLHTGD